MTLRVGTRASPLARIQANAVIERLRAGGIDAEAVPLSTRGDRSLGGDLSTHVGQFVTGLDARLLNGDVDLTVHSSKDVPIDLNESVLQLALLERAPPHDLLLFPPHHSRLPTLEETLDDPTTAVDATEALAHLPDGAHLGTVSVRRQASLLHQRPDLLPIAIRGAVDTRLQRLLEGRADALLLAEAGLRRLADNGALNPDYRQLRALRLNLESWPCAPGQGAIAVHAARDSLLDLESLRVLLDHAHTSAAVREERRILAQLGGGCLSPVAAYVNQGTANVAVAAPGWRSSAARRRPPEVQRWEGPAQAFAPPSWSEERPEGETGAHRLITTASSSRLTDEAALSNVTVVHQQVLKFEHLADGWPKDIIPEGAPRRTWPWLLLSSPSAARMIIEGLHLCPDLARLPWAALGRGTALAALERGHTVAFCAEAEDGASFAAALIDALDPEVALLLPRSDQARPALLERLEAAGRQVQAWTAYRTMQADIEPIEVQASDVLLVTSPSAIRAWRGTGHSVPDNVLCMGEASERALREEDEFQTTSVHRLHGPSAEALRTWWTAHQGGTR
ncbi:MAG: hydroxymethylbilane synthase [Candidatus Thermoplasmatota archaeon]|nr:hydroxymethylbilane synthase [Candidatus Thermoplasmatota archaeon]